MTSTNAELDNDDDGEHVNEFLLRGYLGALRNHSLDPFRVDAEASGPRRFVVEKKEHKQHEEPEELEEREGT